MGMGSGEIGELRGANSSKSRPPCGSRQGACPFVGQSGCGEHSGQMSVDDAILRLAGDHEDDGYRVTLGDLFRVD